MNNRALDSTLSEVNSVKNSERHLLGISMEDYFHVGAFRELISRTTWRRFEPRLERATMQTLDLLDAHGAKATFFTLGWVAEHMPELVREAQARGHEIANSGFSHRGIAELSEKELREELTRGHEAIVAATGIEPRGTRIPDWLREKDLWALDVVADLGYDYDASFRPMGSDCSGRRAMRRRFEHTHGSKTLTEFPVPTMSVAGMLIPIGGGNWFRQLPEGTLVRAVERWQRESAAPFAMYAQTWELDPEQPRITAASWLTTMRHYRNLGRSERLLRRFMSESAFTSYADYLGLEPRRREATAQDSVSAAVTGLPTRSMTDRGRQSLVPVTVVIPCYNEADTLPYLLKTLDGVSRELEARYRISYVFVDDGSSDRTWDVLQSLVGQRADVQTVQHLVNQGIAHAILTGIAASRDEFVCSIDADCTYDPHQIASILPPLEAGADLVTASPYHPDGQVRHVPGWRLLLSRGLSRMYSRRLKSDLHTYTSCFRAYRKSRFAGLVLAHRGFLGIAETLVRSIMSGATVKEVPATLEVRLLGRSKLKVLPVILGHLRLLRDMGNWTNRPVPAALRFAKSSHQVIQ